MGPTTSVDHEGPGVIPGRYAGPAIEIATGPTPQQVEEAKRKAEADQLAGQICAAATLSAQATCTLLELLGEFDASGALRYWVDVKSVAHWLSWTCSMAPGAAREHVRVARALRKMPTVLAEFRQGRLSYSKVREISRVVDIIDETRLIDLARTATAAQLATMISAFRSCDEQRLAQQDKRRLRWHEREDGMVDLRARLTKEDAAVIVAAVNTAKDQFTPPKTAVEATENEPSSYTMVDALVDVGRVFLETAPEDRSGEDRTVVVVHVSAELLAGDVPAGTSEANICHIEGQGAIEPATAQRLACDSPLLPVVLSDGEPLALGRTRRLVSRAQRRALMVRDRMCTYPGCAQTRHLRAHHVRSWANGGLTDLDNLILLCQFHHTTVHEGGIMITRVDRHWEFRMPDERRIETGSPGRFLFQRLDFQRRQAEARNKIAAVDAFNHADARPIQPRWAGERFSVHDCVQALCSIRRTDADPDLLPDQEAA